MTTELTKIQERFLLDLTNANVICMSMIQLQKKYSYIAPKVVIKRDIDELVENGIVKRYHHKMVFNGRISSTTLYQL